MATSERLSVRLSPDIMAELRAAAAAEQRSVAQVARLVLDRWAADRRLSVQGAQQLAELRRKAVEPEEEVASPLVEADPFG